MTNAAIARAGYDQSAKSTSSPRAIEFHLFSRFTAALIAAEKIRNDDNPRYVSALSDNLRLWTSLAAAVSSSENGLEPELRQHIFELFVFTRAHTNRLLAGDREVTSEALVEINRNMMLGLRGQPSHERITQS